MITVKNLSFFRKEQQILYNISLNFSENKVTGIVGPNGCGKSTLLHHLSNIFPSAETVYIDGRDIQNFYHDEFARKVAILTQRNGSMTDDFLVEDIVLMGRYPYKDRFMSYSKDDFSLCASIMEEIGISHLAKKKMGQLSGGERQRVYIAKALAQEPDILLLDEPTNHLDIKYKIQLMEQLRKFEGTVIVVLHDISLAARYCDEAVLMEQGKVIAVGNAVEVLSPEHLQHVFGVAFYTALKNGTCHLYY